MAARHHPAIAAMLPESCGYPATHHDPAKLRKAGPSWLINEHDGDDEQYPRSQIPDPRWISGENIVGISTVV